MSLLKKLKQYYNSNNKESFKEDSSRDTIGLSEMVQEKIDKQLKIIKNRGMELSKKGYSKSEIDKILQDEFGPGKEPIYKWQLGECILSESTKEFFKDEGIKLIDNKYCPDCQSRENLINTMDGWDAAGLPQSGATLCREGCTCTLIKTTK